LIELKLEAFGAELGFAGVGLAAGFATGFGVGWGVGLSKDVGTPF
jgi:hypothetical protein